MSSDPEDFSLFSFPGDIVVDPATGSGGGGGDGDVVVVDVVVVPINKRASAGKSCKSPLRDPKPNPEPSSTADFLSVLTVIRWPDSFGRCTQIAKTIRPVASTRAAITALAKFRGQAIGAFLLFWAFVLCNRLTTVQIRNALH